MTCINHNMCTYINNMYTSINNKVRDSLQALLSS